MILMVFLSIFSFIRMGLLIYSLVEGSDGPLPGEYYVVLTYFVPDMIPAFVLIFIELNSRKVTIEKRLRLRDRQYGRVRPSRPTRVIRERYSSATRRSGASSEEEGTDTDTSSGVSGGGSSGGDQSSSSGPLSLAEATAIVKETKASLNPSSQLPIVSVYYRDGDERYDGDDDRSPRDESKWKAAVARQHKPRRLARPDEERRLLSESSASEEEDSGGEKGWIAPARPVGARTVHVVAQPQSPSPTIASPRRTSRTLDDLEEGDSLSDEPAEDILEDGEQSVSV